MYEYDGAERVDGDCFGIVCGNAQTGSWKIGDRIGVVYGMASRIYDTNCSSSQ